VRVAECCSVLQRAAVCCSMMQCVETGCRVLQSVAARCSVLQLQQVSVLQRVAACCSMSQHARPTQSIMYVPLQVNIFQKSIVLIVQYKYLKSCSGDFILQNLILRTRSCGTGFITQSSWVFHFCQTTLV